MTDEQRRFSASDAGSAADAGETASSAGSSMSSADTVTPEPSPSDRSPSGAAPSTLPVLDEETEDDYEAQIQRAWNWLIARVPLDNLVISVVL